MIKNYVIYKIITEDNRWWYVGKTNCFGRRVKEHIRDLIKNELSKKYEILRKVNSTIEILAKAPAYFSDEEKQTWIDCAEKYYIHEAAKQIYNAYTGLDTNYATYATKECREIVNLKLLNTQLY